MVTRSTLLTLTLFVLCALPLVAGPPNVVVLDGEHTPLQSAIEKANRKTASEKNAKQAAGEKKDRCAAALLAENDDDIAQWCDVAKVRHGKPSDQTFAAGRRVVTHTELVFDGPNQRHSANEADAEKWPTPKLKAFKQTTDPSPGPSAFSGHGTRSRSSALLPSSAANDDHDCTDWVTGEHSTACFDDPGKLKATLTALSTTSCRHVSGSVFFGDSTDGVEDDCWDAKNVLKTTLVESIDEDGPEQLDNDGDGKFDEDAPDGKNNDGDCIALSGKIYTGQVCTAGKTLDGEVVVPLVDEDGPDLIDNDGDGLVNEDGPAPQTEDDCKRLYRKTGLEPRDSDKDADGQCDMGRALVKFVNDEAVRQGKQKLFKAKDDGTYDPDAKNGVEPGKESRTVKLTESFGVKCRRGTTYADGVCVPDDQLAAFGGIEKFHAALSASNDPRTDRAAMMGFTFAPPVIEWGYRIEEEVCVLGICVEIFSARVGYDFDLALGLRLPAAVMLQDEPASVLAGKDATLHAKLRPLDFTAKQYTDLCNLHHLDESGIIGGGGGQTACERFGFPDFLDAALPIISKDKKDGDELVARYEVFAGVNVSVFGFDLINWGIDSSLDLPAACTTYRLLKMFEDQKNAPRKKIDEATLEKAVKLLMGANDVSSTEDGAIQLLQLLKQVSGACGTFTTPFGLDDGALFGAEPGQLRRWPFAGSYAIRADCAEAAANKEVLTIGGKPRPICTNLILGVSGASLGIGLGFNVGAGSKTIDAHATTAEDASGDGGIEWTKADNEDGSAVDFKFKPDNYDGRDFFDTARVRLDDFKYRLDTIEIGLTADLRFGGILSPIPEIGSFPIYNFVISTGTGIPIPQHNGMDPVEIAIPVENYGLQVDVKPRSNDAKVRVDDKTLLVEPGKPGDFDLRVRNLGSHSGTFDNFRITLSNHPVVDKKVVLGMDANTDHDCVPVGKSCFNDGPHSFGRNCYAADGQLLAGMTACIDEDAADPDGTSARNRDNDGDGLIDEDPSGDAWVATPNNTALGLMTIGGILPYTWSSLPVQPAGQSIGIAVTPFRHPMTAPGIYPFMVMGDSTEAKALGMDASDPADHKRKDAADVAFVKVKTFFDPQVVVVPKLAGGKPGAQLEYEVGTTNGANVDDAMSVAIAWPDFNQAACTLTTLGRLAPGTQPGCPYRAATTAIQGVWTTAASVPPFVPAPPSLFAPLQYQTNKLAIRVPRDWAGMDDTTYFVSVTTVSQKDPESPRQTRNFLARHTVVATKESMTRYIGLEIDDLIATLTAADNAGVKLGGLKPIAVYPVKQTNDSALAAVLAGNFAKASTNHATNIQVMQGFVKALDGGGSSGIPAALNADLHKRAAAMIADMTAAQASTVTSLP